MNLQADAVASATAEVLQKFHLGTWSFAFGGNGELIVWNKETPCSVTFLPSKDIPVRGELSYKEDGPKALPLLLNEYTRLRGLEDLVQGILRNRRGEDGSIVPAESIVEMLVRAVDGKPIT
jgi:hypothetical protein